MAIGGVWKESLTELSGGQHSLLALSLILAMLLFRPAHILDEARPALDSNPISCMRPVALAMFCAGSC